MRVVEFTDENQKKRWNDFVASHGSSFLQSWEWGEVEKADGRKVWRLAVENGEDGMKLAASVVKREFPLPFGLKKNYLYIPRGPVFSGSSIDPAAWQEFIHKIKEIAGRERSLFLKIELPVAEEDIGFGDSFFKELGLKRSFFGIQPNQTLIMDLSESRDDLLDEMHPKTRYNIKLAQKKGVVVRGWPGESARNLFEDFWRLLKETASRNRFYLHSRDHYENIFKIFGQSGLCEFYTAEYQSPEGTKEILAAVLVIFYGDTATYLHGASSARHQNLMASRLIHWEAILDAKIKGFKFYDFWGIGEENWTGVTRFKKGFGGEEIRYLGVRDHVFKPGWYWLYKIAKRLRS